MDYTQTELPEMRPEKKMVYEVTQILKTHIFHVLREITKMHITKSMKGKITIDLKQKKLERQMKEGPNTSAKSIFTTLLDIYGKSIMNAVAVNPLNELKEGEAKLADVRINCEVL